MKENRKTLKIHLSTNTLFAAIVGTLLSLIPSPLQIVGLILITLSGLSLLLIFIAAIYKLYRSFDQENSAELRKKAFKSIMLVVLTVIIATIIFLSGIFIKQLFGFKVGVGVTGLSPDITFDGGFNDYSSDNNIDVTDTREFIKITYNATLKVFNVPETVESVENEVRDKGGRVDSSRSDEDRGFVNFVVPKTSFNDFKEGIKEEIHENLITETTTSENKLAEKQAIEKKVETNTGNLIDSNQSVAELTTQRDARLSELRRQISSIEIDIASLRTLVADENNNEAYIEVLNNEIRQLENKLRSLNQTLAKETVNYTRAISNAETAANNAETLLTKSIDEDNDFTNEIATVNGNVKIIKTNWWSYLIAISPIHPFLILTLLVVIGIIIGVRRGWVPAVSIE